jgi:RNA polymerase sigma factor (sigma-70 family)
MPQDPEVRPRTDRELAFAALGGDPDALAALIQRHAATIRQAIARVLRRRDARHIDDVHQTVLLKLCEHGARLLGAWSGIVHPAAPDERIDPYLARIAQRCAIDQLRQLRRRRTFPDVPETPDDPERLFGIGVTVSPEVATEVELQRRLARECLDALPAGARAALRQRILGAPDVEAATRLGISHGAFRQRVSAGTRLLIDCIALGRRPCGDRQPRTSQRQG